MTKGRALDWHHLPPEERRAWWDALWDDVCELQSRYRLEIRSGWWEHPLQSETLAALTHWVALYDEAIEVDPAHKLQLLQSLDRVAPLLRGEQRPFDAERDRRSFAAHVLLSADPMPGGTAPRDARVSGALDRAVAALAEVTARREDSEAAYTDLSREERTSARGERMRGDLVELRAAEREALRSLKEQDESDTDLRPGELVDVWRARRGAEGEARGGHEYVPHPDGRGYRCARCGAPSDSSVHRRATVDRPTPP